MRPLAFFLCLLWTFCLHGSPKNPFTNSQKLEEVKGKILSIQTLNLVTRPTPFVQLTVLDGNKEVTVEVGPLWFIRANGFSLSPSQKIEIKGQFIEVNNQKILFAAEIRKGDSLLKLRNASGEPLWCG